MRYAGTNLSNFLSLDNLDSLSHAGAKSRSTENQASMISDAHVAKADIFGDAQIEAAKYGASATRAQGAAAGQSSMFSGLGSMASGIAGGIASRPSPTVPKPTALESFDAGTFFANSFLNP